MKNEKFMVNYFFDEGLRGFQSIFPRKCGRTVGICSPGLNVAVLVVSLNLPRSNKFRKKLIILRLDSLESCRSFDNFNLQASLKTILVYFFLVTMSIFSCCLWGFVVPLFCSLMPNVKVLSFRSEKFKKLSEGTHFFGRTFIFCTFCLQWWGFEFAPARGSPAIVSDHVMTSQDYIKVEHVSTWLLNSRLAKFQQF